MIFETPAPLTLSPAALRAALLNAITNRERREIAQGDRKSSAVLVPLFEEAGESRVWLLRRSASMRRHSGQVAFPGGKRDPADASLQETALREAEEEIGLAAGAVEVLGPLDDYVTITSFVVTPFIGWLKVPLTPRPNPAEVDRVFSVPLSLFFTRARGIWPKVGHTHDGELIWGATAAMMRGLVTVIREAQLRDQKSPQK